MDKKLSQSDIASQLGVSQTAVSLVLRNPRTARVSEEKKGEILAYTRKVNYNPPSRKKTTGNIGWVISSRINPDQPFYHRFLLGMEDRCHQEGLQILLKTWKSLSSLDTWSYKVDGLVVEALLSRDELEPLARELPVVLLNHAVEPMICDMVVPDNIGGIIKAFSHLYERGHRRIGLFGIVGTSGEKPIIHIGERIEGYNKSLEMHGLPLIQEHCLLPEIKSKSIGQTERCALEYLRRWKRLDNPPTAVIALNDFYAIALLKKAAAEGVKVPDELSVVGFDNKEQSRHTSPPLSSVNQRMEDMGRESVALLNRRIRAGDEDGADGFKKVVYMTDLVIRESVGPVAGA